MFGFSWIKIIAGLAVLSVVGSAIYYVYDLQQSVYTLKENAVKTERALEDQNKVIEQQKSDTESIQRNFNEQRKLFEDLDNTVSDLNDRFEKTNAAGKKRDLEALALAKTKRIQTIINNGSDEALRCFEIATGSPLTEKEKNATLKSETNSLCPGIANPNYSLE